MGRPIQPEQPGDLHKIIVWEVVQDWEVVQYDESKNCIEIVPMDYSLKPDGIFKTIAYLLKMGDKYLPCNCNGECVLPLEEALAKFKETLQVHKVCATFMANYSDISDSLKLDELRPGDYEFED